MNQGLFLYGPQAKNFFLHFLKGCIKKKKKNVQQRPYAAYKA